MLKKQHAHMTQCRINVLICKPLCLCEVCIGVFVVEWLTELKFALQMTYTVENPKRCSRHVAGRLWALTLVAAAAAAAAAASAAASAVSLLLQLQRLLPVMLQTK